MNEKNYLELLREFKKSSGWSYHKLSNHVGVHYQTIVGWLAGKCDPSLMALDRIKKFLRSVERKNEIEKRKK